MSFLGYQELIRDGDTAIVFLGHDSMKPMKMLYGTTTQTKFGALRHGDIIGKRYGSRICTLGGKGWVYVLHPTPELWTVNLPHRTQVLYFPDISLATMELELKPGSVVVEAGTGSGSVSHAFARTIAPSGHLYTFEFHEQRALTAAEEFKEHGLSHVVTTTFRDVSQDGFLLDTEYVADAVFLDLPSPWTVIPHAKKVLCSSGGRICSFSPCIEQVQRACQVLDQLGFTDIKTVECLMRPYSVRTINMNLPNFGEPRTEEVVEDGGAGDAGKNGGGARPSDQSRVGARPSDPQPNRDVHTQKCAVPQWEIPGHTGYLTFATLFTRQSQTTRDNEGGSS